MPQVLSDIIDIYVFRRLNARVQFLLLQRRADVALPHTWQAVHAHVRIGDTTIESVIDAVRNLTGLNVSAIYSADYINQFYDEGRDAIILAPVFAANVSPQAPIDLGDDFRDAAWFDRDEATARLPFSGQRWAVRHIDEIMSLGEAEASLYQVDMSTVQPPQREPEAIDLDDDDTVYDAILDDTAPEGLDREYAGTPSVDDTDSDRLDTPESDADDGQKP